MYEELASVRGVVDLTSEAALDEAETFLTQLGYMTVQRTDSSLLAERCQSGGEEGQEALELRVEAASQPGGGVRINVLGNDREGVQERQTAWAEWSESLPKKPDMTTGDKPENLQERIETPTVPLPPPPTVESHDLPPPQSTSTYPSFAPTEGQGTNMRRIVLVLGGCIVLPLVLVGFVGCLAILGSVAGDGGTSGGSGSGTTFTKENYTDLIADPDGNRGASVDIVGKVFRPPEVRENESVFQMWADPKNAEGNMMIRTDPGSAKVNTDDYVRVQGTVLGSLEGENLFGGTIGAVEIEADSVEKANPTEALDQAQKTTQVGQTQQDKGFSITVDKVEFGQETTRVYYTARNGTRNDASFFTHDASIVQGSRQVNAEDSFKYDLPEPQSDLRPGVEEEGVVAFGRVDPSRPFQVRFNWFSEDFRIEAQPLVFDISP